MFDAKEEFLQLISLMMNDSKFNLLHLYPHSEELETLYIFIVQK